MKEILSVILLIAGLLIGWFINDLLTKDPTYKVHLTLEQATKQSKFNLVRDDFAEYFYLCEEEGLGINHWKALILTGYSFQYGVDAKNVSVQKISKEDVQPEEWAIEVHSLDILSSELKIMKAFTLDKAWFKNAEKRISTSKDELVRRKESLAAQRMYGDPNRIILKLMEQSIKETIINLSKALGKEIIISTVTMPPPPENWETNLDLNLTYQCGDVTPVFGKEIDKFITDPPIIREIEVIELPIK